jgi:hypothetical protein
MLRAVVGYSTQLCYFLKQALSCRREHELNVKVTTDAQVYRVRDKAKVTIEVKRAADGKPAPKQSAEKSKEPAEKSPESAEQSKPAESAEKSKE